MIFIYLESRKTLKKISRLLLSINIMFLKCIELSNKKLDTLACYVVKKKKLGPIDKRIKKLHIL